MTTSRHHHVVLYCLYFPGLYVTLDTIKLLSRWHHTRGCPTMTWFYGSYRIVKIYHIFLASNWRSNWLVRAEVLRTDKNQYRHYWPAPHRRESGSAALPSNSEGDLEPRLCLTLNILSSFCSSPPSPSLYPASTGVPLATWQPALALVNIVRQIWLFRPGATS